MKNFKCPICEAEIKMEEPLKISERFNCENCFAELALHKHKKNIFLGCALCKEPGFDPNNCADCERRQEKKSILDEGRL